MNPSIQCMWLVFVLRDKTSGSEHDVIVNGTGIAVMMRDRVAIPLKTGRKPFRGFSGVKTCKFDV